ncbi:MAG: hypothetical protein JXA94_06960 [Parachlamydiales bacterium]|nr:hypothetical protein [Parachlamydiales bacterium]
MTLKRTKLQNLFDLLSNLEKSNKKPHVDILKKLTIDINEEEKMSRFYLQVTQSNTSSGGKKRAMIWNAKVIELKQRLLNLIKK